MSLGEWIIAGLIVAFFCVLAAIVECWAEQRKWEKEQRERNKKREG